MGGLRLKFAAAAPVLDALIRFDDNGCMKSTTPGLLRRNSSSTRSMPTNERRRSRAQSSWIFYRHGQRAGHGKGAGTTRRRGRTRRTDSAITVRFTFSERKAGISMGSRQTARCFSIASRRPMPVGRSSFSLSPELRRGFDDIAATVRKGGTAQTELGATAPEHPIWLEFARGMAPMMMRPAQTLADLIPLEGAPKVLDVSASHGTWGMAFAQKHPRAHLVALDWAPVLELTRENAERAGLKGPLQHHRGERVRGGSRVRLRRGVVPNFLHHFNKQDCVRFLKKVHAALREGGRVAIAEFVPNPDRVSPPEVASFSFIMLANTPEGDAYTLSEFEEMLDAAPGFMGRESRSCHRWQRRSSRRSERREELA